MDRVEIILGPLGYLLLIRGVGIDAHHDLRPIRIPIIPGSFGFANARGSAGDWIHMHGGMHSRHRLTEADVLRDRLVTELVYKIGAPIPLQSRRINWIEHALQYRLGHWTDEIEGRLLESANRFKHFLRFRLRLGA